MRARPLERFRHSNEWQYNENCRNSWNSTRDISEVDIGAKSRNYPLFLQFGTESTRYLSLYYSLPRLYVCAQAVSPSIGTHCENYRQTLSEQGIRAILKAGVCTWERIHLFQCSTAVHKALVSFSLLWNSVSLSPYIQRFYTILAQRHCTRSCHDVAWLHSLFSHFLIPLLLHSPNSLWMFHKYRSIVHQHLQFHSKFRLKSVIFETADKTRNIAISNRKITPGVVLPALCSNSVIL